MPTRFKLPNPRIISKTCQLAKPPETGVPVPGANPGSSTSISNEIYTGEVSDLDFITSKTSSTPFL